MVDVLRLDRHLLAVYLVAMLVLLLLPVSGPQFQILGIESDKWTHIALFGGLSFLLRCNLTSRKRGSLISVIATLVFAIVIEIAQGVLDYRNADLSDLLASFAGAVLGVAVTNRMLASSTHDRPFGILIVILGMLVVFLSALADVIGVSRQDQFGPYQIAGIALGILAVAGGVRVYFKGWRVNS